VERDQWARQDPDRLDHAIAQVAEVAGTGLAVELRGQSDDIPAVERGEGAGDLDGGTGGAETEVDGG